MPVGSRQVNEECRGNAGLREDFEGSCRKAFFAPLSGVLHRFQKKTMLFPFSIKGRTFGRDANESLHGIKGFACPGVVNVFLKRHHFSMRSAIQIGKEDSAGIPGGIVPCIWMQSYSFFRRTKFQLWVIAQC